MIAAIRRIYAAHILPEIDLTPYLLTPGYRVITRREESRRAREAYGRAEARRLRECRLRFEVSDA